MKELKKYQEVALDKLINRTKEFFKEDGNETIVFQAPTGSGKTFIATQYINNIIKELTDDICFLWVSIGKGELHKQSYKSVKKDVSDEIKCSILEEEFFGSRDKIYQNEIVFLNWEKVRTKNKDTGDWKNVAMQDKDQTNFIEVLQNTRNCGRKIILIIDESHASANSDRAMEIRDEIVKPEITIEMSATPILVGDSKITVDSTDVIEEGMIKKEILINPDIDKIEDDELNSQELIIKCAMEKREKLAKEYKDINSPVNPLVLIQIPNSDSGEDKKNAIVSILRDKGITEENGKLAIWLSDEKVNTESETLLPIDGKVEYLIFKQAIDTGWDCPRAQILVKFREINSIVFEIQTVGRILRMPEAHHYDNEELNDAYVYTNIQSIVVKKEIYNPNIIKSLKSSRSDIYKPIKLRSYYKQRIDFGDITTTYYPVFEECFCKYFDIKENTMPDYFENMEKLKLKGIKTDFEKMDGIIRNGNILSGDLDSLKSNISSDLFAVNYSDNDLGDQFETLIKENLNGFAPRRSLSTVKQAIYYTFKKILNINSYRGGSLYIQNMVIKNRDIFSILLDTSTTNYKIIHEEDVSKKSIEKFNNDWEIPITKNYNPTIYIKYNLETSLYQPLYIRLMDNGEPNKLETDFLDYINSKKEFIDWIWQNGQEHMETNFGIQKEDGYTFQPDFLIKFKDGRIGIFDTKGVGEREEDNREKANALEKYIEEERTNGKNLIGGLVVKSGSQFRINLESEYAPFNENSEDWGYFEELFK
jgi:type III restriction enzyme